MALDVVEFPEDIAWLDLSFNDINGINDDILQFQSLKMLYLHGNKIRLDLLNTSQPGPSAASSDGSGSKFFDLGQIGSAIYGLSLDLENFPLKCQIFQIFSLLGQKKSLRIGSKKNLGQRQVGF